MVILKTSFALLKVSDSQMTGLHTIATASPKNYKTITILEDTSWCHLQYSNIDAFICNLDKPNLTYTISHI